MSPTPTPIDEAIAFLRRNANFGHYEAIRPVAAEARSVLDILIGYARGMERAAKLDDEALIEDRELATVA